MKAAPGCASRDGHVHPMDLQMAIFHCADDFLRQTLATKLAFCQLAVPLLLPNPSTSRIEFLLYALSQIQRSWKEVEKSGEQAQIKSYSNKLIFQAQTPIVSFIRIGSSASSSKSQLLNALLSKRKHDTFFHRNCRGSTRERLLMEGMVEIAWYCPGGSPDDTFERCVAFCNLHGDARDHGAQLLFLQEISAVNVALVSDWEHMDSRGKKILQDLWQSQSPLVCLLTEQENVEAGEASKNITIGIKNRNEAELMDQLTKTIGDLLEESNACFSLEACVDIWSEILMRKKSKKEASGNDVLLSHLDALSDEINDSSIGLEHLLREGTRLENKIRNGDLQKVTREHLEGLVQETSDAIEKEVEKYFSEDKDRETLVQWKSGTEMKLKELKETLLDEIKKKCENLIELQKEQKKLDARKLQYEDELLRRSRELAVSLKGKSLSERELKDNFTLVWNKWIAEVSRDACLRERVDIDAEIEDVLVEHFKEPGIHERIRSYAKSRGFSFDPEKHIMKKKYFGYFSDPRRVSNADVIKFQHITDNIIERVMANISKKEEEKPMASQEDTQEGDAKAQLIAEALQKAGLDAGSWLPKIMQTLGIKCREALQHLEYKDYLRLECVLRHPWEKKALQKLLKITDGKMSTKGVQKEHLKKTKQKQEEAKQALKDLTEMLKSRSQELSPELKRERLVFMEDHMKGLWSTQIKNLLQKQSRDKDWERLERDLDSLISGCLDDKWDEQRMQNILSDLEDTFLTPEAPSQSQSKSDSRESKVNEAMANQEFLQLLKRLGLESHYPRKMGMGDFRTICKVSLQDSQPTQDTELLFYFLQKLLTVDYRVRCLTCWERSNPKLAALPKIREQEHKKSDSFENFLDKLMEASPERASRDGHVHPMDLQMAIFHCADDFLRQSLATKLAFCQLALPLLLPNPSTSHIEFPLYTLSQIQRSWKEAKKSGKQARTKSYNNKLIFQAQTPIVSFIRIGFTEKENVAAGQVSKTITIGIKNRNEAELVEQLTKTIGDLLEGSNPSISCKKENFVKLPEIAADLMDLGYPVELMDGDASYLPLCWVGAIFDSLIERLGDKRVFVLSVLGIQSTGKSTLLNAMFGLQFNVSAGRCTRGAFMQLIPVGEELQQDLGFDFVLVVDTEGLRAIEMANKQSLNHDKELATFVIGVGNVTVINIFGENPSEMQDVLQIAVQAFLRMKKVNLSPSCIFVHQNVGEATAKEQNMEGQRRFQAKLDEMTVVAAQQEFCDISSFSDVIAFDVNTHIHYFAHLWEGNPPMAPPNPTYSQNVQQLKNKILQAAKNQSQRSILRFSSLKDRIGDLWNALLNENFVFSFKNSLEIAVYRKLESTFSQWTWRLRSHILDVQMRLDNKIRNGDRRNVTREHLEGLVQETSDAIEKEVEKYFREDKDRETLVQWKRSTELKLKELKETLLDETKKKCENLIELQKEQRKLDARKLQYEDELLRKSRELAVSLKGKSLTERELKDNFTLVWNQWIAEVFRDARPLERVDIDVEIEDVLLEHFKEPGIHARIMSFPKDKLFYLDPEKHIMKKSSFSFFPGFWNLSNADVINFQHITNNIIERVMANISKKEEEKRDYSRNFIHEILNEVQKGVNSVPSNGKCTFNREYSIDLSLYLCKIAAERFKAMHEAFQKANDPVVYLSSKREDFFQCFQISCQGATSGTTFAVFLCDKIEPALRQAVSLRTAKDIAEDMQGQFPDFQGSRSNLEVCILKYLAEEENFEYFKQFLTSPKRFCQSYIETRVRNHCLDGSRRLKMFLDSSLDHLYRNILSAVSLSTQIVKDRKDREDKISLWLDEFCRQLSEVINLPRSDLKGIEHQEVTDIEFLSSAMTEALAALRERLMKELADADLSSFSRQPHTILAEHFSGCWEQCPFCGAVCTNTMWNHDGDHQLVFHRPQALMGGKWHGTDHLVIDICSSLVASDCSFRVRDDEWIPYKRYRDAGPPYSTWNILPDSSMQAYWKWFVSHFRTQLEALYNRKFQGRGEIPEAWQRITKEEALAELEKR
ncbi:interferon-induced very large GTPase 1-like [Passer montanus]|uniref:interferon-induced very large GTPase 1-like n=1 Tax=Passer montanus TaxID=9160 RepID=UPI0019610E5A|nr:interferon-induced very large GTPase 1-like [Passer montanus]